VTILRFTIPGPPVAWQRAGRNRATGATFTKEATRSYQALIKEIAGGMMDMLGLEPLTGPLQLCVTVLRPAPKSWPKRRATEIWDTRRPDFDNLGKTVADALNGIAYGDDAQIAKANIEKRIGSPACVWVEIRKL
jgi:Holliday junction resolvase RusA-like endonuclease